MNKISKILKRLRKRSRNGHWLVYLCLLAVVVGLWVIPLETLTHQVGDFEAKIGLISTVLRGLAEELTVTVKSMGTFAAALVALGYIIYNRRSAK